MNPMFLSPSSRFTTGAIRSPSRSPNRHKYFTSHDVDPLLSNLSPTSTLEALESTDALVSEGGASQDALQDSIVAASTSERALGIRAALAGKKLKEWYRELTAWPWPSTPDGNGFRPPIQKERGTNGAEYNNESYINNNDINVDSTGKCNGDGEDYYGSLPARLIDNYEHRIEVIKDGMEALDLEALKEFVRDAHATANSRSKPRRLQGNGMNTGYNHLDDFTAIITATIMQALPTISHLTSLLSVWSIRLLVLRQVPEFVRLSDKVRLSMINAWKYLNSAEAPIETYEESGITRAALLAKRAALESEIFGLGRGLDNMLDALEGREDTIPEEWIEDMESTEAEFGDWVVESEKKLIEGEWKIHERNALAELSKPKQIQPFKGNTAANSAPEEFGAVLKKTRESAEIERSPILSPSSHSRSNSPEPTLSEHKNNEHHGILEPEERPEKFSTSVSQSSSIPPRAPLQPTSRDEHTAPELQKLALWSTDSRVIHDSLGQHAGNEKVVGEPDFFTAISVVAEDQPGLEPAKKASQGDANPYSQQIGHNEGTRNREISDSPIEPQSGCLEHQSKDQSNTVSKLVTKRSFENDGNNKIVETPDTDVSRLHIALHSSAPESSKTQPQDHSRAKKAGTSRPAPLVLKQMHSNIESAASSEMSSDTSHPGSGTSEYFSNMSSPEIQHASVAEYFDNPVEISTPSRVPSTPLAAVSRQSSQRTERGELGIFENGSPQRPVLPINHRRRASTFAPVSKTLVITGSIDEPPSDRSYLKSHLRVRSASLRSFEIIPRHEVRNITISRKGSYSSTIPEPSTSEPAEDAESTQSPNTLRLNGESLIATLNDRPQAFFEGGDQTELVHDFEDESRKIVQNTTPRPSPRASAKSRRKFESVSDLSPGSTLVKFRRRTTMNMSSDKINKKNIAQPSICSPSKSSEDQLEARISSILTEIPGHIQLRSGPEPDAREVLPLGTNSDRKKPNALSPALKMMRARTSLQPPPLTLTPAHPPMSRSRTQVGEPEVKLYHLHQVGKDVPVKLFVRLVGEGGERVMVRIGGGWADLGEYLKEYASHHGRRSVSDGRFEIQGLPQPTTPISTLAGISSPAASPASRPNSSSGGPGFMVAHRRSRHSTSSSADFDGPMTPDNPIYRQLETTPGSVESNMSSFRPSSRLSLTDDDSPLGLAGPTTRRKDVSPSKQAWVDGMVDQARKASAEKKKGQDGDFGDLGKVGATKRVYMKSRRDV